MKSDHWFSRNRLLSQLRIASGVTLISAAAAMAFVAATDNDLTIGNGSRKARPLPAFGGKLTAQDLAGNGGEPAISESDQDGLDRAAQEAYRHRAYPATEVRIADTLNAQKAWAKIKGKSAKAGVNAQGQWSLAGPSIASYPGSLTLPGHARDRCARGASSRRSIGQRDSSGWEHRLRRVGPGRPGRWGSICWRILAGSHRPACRSLESD